MGYFAYWVHLFGTDNAGFICNFTFETVVLIPGFLLSQVFLYIGIINRNIRKHGAFLSYLFENGLTAAGLGENHYARFLALNEIRPGPLARVFESLGIHFSQLVLGVLAGASVLLYAYVEWHGGFGLLVDCAITP